MGPHTDRQPGRASRGAAAPSQSPGSTQPARPPAGLSLPRAGCHPSFPPSFPPALTPCQPCARTRPPSRRRNVGDAVPALRRLRGPAGLEAAAARGGRPGCTGERSGLCRGPAQPERSGCREGRRRGGRRCLRRRGTGGGGAAGPPRVTGDGSR